MSRREGRWRLNEEGAGLREVLGWEVGAMWGRGERGGRVVDGGGSGSGSGECGRGCGEEFGLRAEESGQQGRGSYGVCCSRSHEHRTRAVRYMGRWDGLGSWRHIFDTFLACRSPAPPLSSTHEPCPP